MVFTQLLLEVICGYDFRSNKSTKVPKFCRYGIKRPGFHCFENDCSFKNFTQCPNGFVYVGSFGEVKDRDSYIGFGGDMYPDSVNDDASDEEIKIWEDKSAELINIWEGISKKKIAQAYDEFMDIKRNRKKQKF